MARGPRAGQKAQEAFIAAPVYVVYAIDIVRFKLLRPAPFAPLMLKSVDSFRSYPHCANRMSYCFSLITKPLGFLPYSFGPVSVRHSIAQCDRDRERSTEELRRRCVPSSSLCGMATLDDWRIESCAIKIIHFLGHNISAPDKGRRHYNQMDACLHRQGGMYPG